MSTPPRAAPAVAVPRIGYVGCGAYVPPTVVTNEDLSRIVDTNDEWIRRRTGIRTRRVLGKDETILDMAVAASRRALDDAGVTPEEIGDIRVGVNTWLRFPSLACQLQHALGCQDASAADVSAGCAGFIYAVEEAYNKIFVEKMRSDHNLIALVVGVEGLSHITDWTDRNTCVLLGDGAGAVVMRQVESGGILGIHTHAQGKHGDLLYSPPCSGTRCSTTARSPSVDGPKLCLASRTIAITVTVRSSGSPELGPHLPPIRSAKVAPTPASMQNRTATGSQ